MRNIINMTLLAVAAFCIYGALEPYEAKQLLLNMAAGFGSMIRAG